MKATALPVCKKKYRSVLTPRFNGFDVLIYAALALFTLITLYPFVYTLAGSFSDAQELVYGPAYLLPKHFTASSYLVELSDTRLFRAMLNTVVSTVFSLALALAVTSGAAYAFASRALRFRKTLWILNIIPMFVSGGMIPYYLVILQIGLYDNFLVYIIPSLYSVYNMIILSNFFKGIDDGMREAAVLDGANEYRIWLQIFMPLSKPALVTIGLWIIVGKWNSYTPTMLYTSRQENMWLLQYYLMRLIKYDEIPTDRGLKYWEVNADTLSFAAITISTLPIIILYPLLSRFFAKGLTLGSVKG